MSYEFWCWDSPPDNFKDERFIGMVRPSRLRDVDDELRIIKDPIEMAEIYYNHTVRKLHPAVSLKGQVLCLQNIGDRWRTSRNVTSAPMSVHEDGGIDYWYMMFRAYMKLVTNYLGTPKFIAFDQEPRGAGGRYGRETRLQQAFYQTLDTEYPTIRYSNYGNAGSSYADAGDFVESFNSDLSPVLYRPYMPDFMSVHPGTVYMRLSQEDLGHREVIPWVLWPGFRMKNYKLSTVEDLVNSVAVSNMMTGATKFLVWGASSQFTRESWDKVSDAL